MRMPAGHVLVAGRGLAVAGAMSLGAAVVLVSGWITQDWLRVLIVLALFALGVVINGGRTHDEDAAVTRALSAQVRTGIGTAATFLGAYLAGSLIAVFISGGDQPPSPAVIILLVYGFPLLALLRFVTRGMWIGWLGTAIVVPLLIALLLLASGAGTGTVAVVNLGIAMAALVAALVLPGERGWVESVEVFGGMAASSAVGAGTSAIGSIGGQPGTGAQPGSAGALPAAPQTAVLALGLLLAVGFVLLAVVRRHVVGGIVAASVLAQPPAGILINSGVVRHTGPDVVLLAVPILVVLVAVVALLVRPFRSPVLCAAIAVAFVVVTQALAQFGVEFEADRSAAIVGAVLTVGSIVLACVVPGDAGVVTAAAVLVGLGLNEQWWRVAFSFDYGGTTVGERVMAGVGLVITVAVTVLVVWRHRAPAVWAAAAYALLGAIATMLASLWEQVFAVDPFRFSGVGGDLLVIAWLIGPVVLLGIPAAVAALRGRDAILATGQAVGALVLAAGGFVLALMLIATPRQPNGFVGLASLLPTVPWSTPTGPTVPSTGGFWIAALAMFAIAVPLLSSTIRRPSTPLTAAGIFVVAEAAAVCLSGVADKWSGQDVTKLVVVVVIVAAVVILAAAALLTRRDDGIPPHEPTMADL